MPFGRDYEIARPSDMPAWMDEFANRELAREAAGDSPFHELRSLFQRNKSLSAVESKVKELSGRIGLDLVRNADEDQLEKTAAQHDTADMAQFVEELRCLADEYDSKGMTQEADAVDALISMTRKAVIRHVERAKERGEGTTKKWCVYPKGGGDSLGCHDTKEEAQEQLAAIEANKADDSPGFCIRMAGWIPPLSIRAQDEEPAPPFPQDSRVKKIIDNIVQSRKGHVSPWAIVQQLRGEFARDAEREKLNPEDEAIQKYIKDRIDELREDVEETADDMAGYGVGLQTSQEDVDLEDKMFEPGQRFQR